MGKPDKAPQNDDDIQELLAGFDPELEALPAQINWLRPVLMLVVIIFAGWVATKFQPELEYFFSSSEPINLGDATEFASDDDTQEKLNNVPHNRYVSLRGYPTRPSLSCDPAVRYFKLIGEQIYVEEPMSEEVSSIECRAMRKERNPKVAITDTFEGSGRLISFDRLNQRYGGFLSFYEKSYDERFCSIMTDAGREARLNILRQVVREQYKEKNGAYPPDAELERLVGQEKLCYNAILIQAGKTPMSFWPYLAVCILLGAIILWNIFLLIQWTRRTLAILR